jgi:hypothetical protein
MSKLLLLRLGTSSDSGLLNGNETKLMIMTEEKENWRGYFC